MKRFIFDLQRFDSFSNSTSNTTISGTSSGDNICNYGNYVTVTGYAGNDSIDNRGSYVSISGGSDDDLFHLDPYYAGSTNNITLTGGTGNDIITASYRAYEDSINGGAGSDKISISNSTSGYNGKNTIVGGYGNDTIYGNTNATIGNIYQYAAGDGNDVINSYSSLDTLQIGGGTDTYSSVVSGNNVIFTVGTGTIKLKNFAGNSIHIVGKAANPNTWKLNGTTATYGTSKKTLITIKNVKSLDGISLNETDKVVTLAKSFLNEKKVTISGDGYTLALADDVYKSKTTAAGWTVSGTTATYKTKEITAGYTLASNKKSISHTKASGGATKITLSGLKSGTKASYLTLKNNVVTISKNAIGTGKITAKGDGYTFVLGSSGKLTYAGSKATLKGSTGKDSIAGGSKADTIYGGKGNDTLTGGKGNDVFVYTNGDGNDKITDFSKSGTDTLRIGEDGKGNYSLNTIKNDVVVTIGKGSVTLVSAAKLSKLNIEGTKDDPIIVKGKGVTLTEDYDDKTFELVGKYDSALTVDASAVMSELKIVGNNKANRIIGSSQNDTIIGGKGNDCLKGGEGSDVFVYNKGDGNDKILDYTADEDLISIKGDKVTGITTKGNNAVLELASKGKISLIGGDYDVISYSDSNGEHSYFRKIENFVNFKSGGKIANIKSNYSKETFDSIDYSKYADKVVTINASAVDQSMNIVGNNKSNYIKGTADSDTIDGGSGKDTIYGGNGNDKIYGGSGDDCLSGGAGNDSLWGNKGDDYLIGGAGKDVFYYTPGDGIDTISDYDFGVDKIILLSGKVTNVESERNGYNVIIDIGSEENQIIVENPGNQAVQILDKNGTPFKKQYTPK